MKQRFAATIRNAKEAKRFYEAYDQVLRFSFDDFETRPVSVDITVSLLPRTIISLQSLSSAQVERTPTHVANSPIDTLDLLIPLAGRGGLSIPGRGEIAFGIDSPVPLIDSELPFRGVAEQHSTGIVLSFPRHELAPGIADPDKVRRLGLPNSGAIALLSGYARTLLGTAETLSAGELAAADNHLHDLALLALGGKKDHAHAARERGLRAARLLRIKADLLAHLGDPDISLDWLARRHQISPRYIRDLFALEGTSFTDFLLQARLDKAHQLLAHPDTQLSITAIALATGFGDISWFNTAFRRRFGIAPSDLRRPIRR